MYAFHSKSFLSTHSRRSSSATSYGAEPAPEDELLRRRDGGDRVDLQEAEPLHGVEDRRRRPVEELCADGDAARFVRRYERHDVSGSCSRRQRTSAESSDSGAALAAGRPGVEPVGVARRERCGGCAVREHREPDGDEDRRQDQLLVRQRTLLLEQQEGEDDGGGASRPEPPEERDRRAARARSEHGDRDGHHPHERQAEDGVERDLPGQVAERGAEENRAEDDERDGGEHRAGLLHEVRDVAAAMAPEPAEHHPADERGDEAGAADRLGEAVSEQRAGERHDLEPGGVDEAATSRIDDDSRCCRPRDHTAEHAVPDLLQHELGRSAVSDRAVLRQRDGERDEEERDADPVVQPALDVEALADAYG